MYGYPGMPHRRDSAGFTLVELLSVIAVLAILVAILIPTVGRVMNARDDTVCRQRLRQLHGGFQLYATDNQGAVVKDGSEVWTETVRPYMGISQQSQEIYEFAKCPAVTDRPGEEWWRSDYGANIHGAVHDTNFQTTAPTQIIANQNNPTQVVLFLDWLPGWRFARVFEYARVNGADAAKVFRHNNMINAVFLDGHVDTMTHPLPTDLKSPPWRSDPTNSG